MDSRIPPAEIRKTLRKEVNYGCPKCRSPFLEYHHFDPPWHEGKVHNVQGMIALCPLHHNMADGGITWTKDDLRRMKAQCEEMPVKGSIEWDLERSVLLAGNNYFIGKGISLRVLGYEIFKLKRNIDGKLVLNLLLWDENQNVILEIVENDIIAHTQDIKDFNCTATANKIRVDARDNQSFFEVEMKRLSLEKFISIIPKDLRDDESIINICKGRLVEGRIPVIVLRAKIITNKFIVEIRNPDIVFDFRRMGYDRAPFSGRFFEENASLSFTNSNKNNELIYLGR